MDSAFDPQNQSVFMWDPSQFSTPATTPNSFYPLPPTLRSQNLVAPCIIIHCPSCHSSRPVSLMPSCNYGPGVGHWSPVPHRQRQFSSEPEFYRDEMTEGSSYHPAEDYFGYPAPVFEFPEFPQFIDAEPHFDFEGFQIEAEFQDVFENPEEEQKKKRGKRGVRGGKNRGSRSRVKLADDNHCALCKSNREMEEVFMGHVLKDAEGKVSCPVLRAMVCIICGATGDDAHTLKYCPQREEAQLGPPLPSNSQIPYRKVRNAAGRLVSLKF